MNSRTKQAEKEYLGNVKSVIDIIQTDCLSKIKANEKQIQNCKNYFVDNFYDIKKDCDELANINLQIENLEQNNTALSKLSDRLGRQKKMPYFGRFDFKTDTSTEINSYYIGVGHIQKNGETYVYDWRADISSLYYDDVLGATSYTCPDGIISGNLSLKRQFKIENGNLKYFIDSNLVIDDNILMEELSKNATSKMHDIVSTIQKEQNALIRNDDFHNMIVQGVAGSGKTSVAMHKVSYLLYKYRKTLKSEDILVLSPSELFADYIDDVLPSLGEDKPFTTTFAHMAKRLLGENFESRESLLDKLSTNGSQDDFEDIAIKYSFEFLEDFKNFLNNDICNLFVPKTLVFGNLIIEEKEIRDIYYNKLKGLPIYKRIEIIAEQIVDRFNIPPSKNMDFYNRAKQILFSKLITTDLVRIYNIFLRSVDLKEIKTVGAYDIAQILLIKENLFGLSHNYDAKYVIVDEMQDYTPCHFYLFEKLWKCPKMYLGDIYQSIDKSLTKDYLILLAKECKAKITYLTKSYRSTLQISKFSQKILGKKIANNVNRNGEEVEFLKTSNCVKRLEKIISKKEKEHPEMTLCIICKNMSEIKKLQDDSPVIKKFTVLTEKTGMTEDRNIITTTINAKGVEFDMVVIPFTNSNNYKTELDKNLLYVACTRALHKLYFISDGAPSKFLTRTKMN